MAAWSCSSFGGVAEAWRGIKKNEAASEVSLEPRRAASYVGYVPHRTMHVLHGRTSPLPSSRPIVRPRISRVCVTLARVPHKNFLPKPQDSNSMSQPTFVSSVLSEFPNDPSVYLADKSQAFAILDSLGDYHTRLLKEFFKFLGKGQGAYNLIKAIIDHPNLVEELAMYLKSNILIPSIFPRKSYATIC